MFNNKIIIGVYHIFKGVIRTSSKMDRELQDSYWVIVQAKDRIGLPGALSGTTRVLITLSDINDNIPTFKKGKQKASWIFIIP